MKIVADKAGIEVAIDNIKTNSVNKNENLYEIYDIATKFYQNNISTVSGQKAKEYLYDRGFNDDDPMQDMLHGLLVVNDNDIIQAINYKKRKEKQLNARELPSKDSEIDLCNFALINRQTGLVYDDDNIDELICQSPDSNEEDVG